MLEEHRVVKEMKKMKEKNKEQLIVAIFGKNPKNRENKVIRELEKIERKANEKKR